MELRSTRLVLTLVAWQLTACAASMTVVAPDDRPTPDAPTADHAQAFARALRDFDSGGTIERVRWREDGLTFERLGSTYVYDIAAGEQRLLDEDASPEADRPRRGRSRPPRGAQRERVASPDGQWTAVCRDWNVVLEPTDENERALITVTTEGTRKFRYGTASWVYGEELRQRNAMWWTPDSTELVFYAFDEREVADFFLLDGLTELRTSVLREGYPKAGEPNPRVTLMVYDLATRERRKIPTRGAEGEEWYVYGVELTTNPSLLLFHRTNRHQNVLEVVATDLETDRQWIVVRETQDTWQRNLPTMHMLGGGRFIWETERTGLRQYELRSLSGERLATLTSGSRPVASIEHVDEERELLYYVAYGDDHPLNTHLFRVRLDGSDRRRLTERGSSHTVSIDPTGRWFTDRAETLTRMPTTAMYDVDGHRLATLAQPIAARFETLHVPDPELFSYTAGDGVTTLYGWLYKPPGFDETRRYPLVVEVYGGPNSKGVTNRFRGSHEGCGHGFLMARFDNRGTGGRSKAFLGSVYQQLGVIDIEDQALGVRHLSTRRYVDRERIGIYGHSHGGYMAALAILKYPALYDVAVAMSPVTDWRHYDTIFTERFMRTPQENPLGYDAGSCMTYADQLEGRLLLMHGLEDDNVHPNNTFELLTALRTAGKDADTIIYPDAGHGLRRGARQQRWAYLRRHLLAPRP